MTLICELPSILEDINSKNELINYGDTWRKLHAKPPPPLNPDLVASTVPGASGGKNSRKGNTAGLMRTSTQSPSGSAPSGRQLVHTNSEPSLAKPFSADDRGPSKSYAADDTAPTISITPAYLPTLIAQRHAARTEPLPTRIAPSKRRQPPLNPVRTAEATPRRSQPPSARPSHGTPRPQPPSEGNAVVWGSDAYELPLSTLFPANSVQMSIARHVPDTRVPNRLHQTHVPETIEPISLRQKEEEELRLVQQKKALARTEKQSQMEAQQLLLLRQLQTLQAQQQALLQQFQDLQVSYQQSFHTPLQLPEHSPLPHLPPLVIPNTVGKRFPHIVAGFPPAGSHSQGHQHHRTSSSPAVASSRLELSPALAYPLLKSRHRPLPQPSFHPVFVPPKEAPSRAVEHPKTKPRLSISAGTASSKSKDIAPSTSTEDVRSSGTSSPKPSSDGRRAAAAASPQDSSRSSASTSSSTASQAAQSQQHHHQHHQQQQQRYQAQMAQQQAHYAQQQAAAAAAAQQQQQQQQQMAQQQQQYNGRARLVFFTQHNEGPIPTIQKDVAHVHAPRESGLSRLFAIVEVYVFVPHRKKPLVLRVPQTTNFGQLSAVAIKTRNSTPKLPPHRRLEENPDAYCVRIAGRNGQPDERYPGVLSKRNGNIESWLRYAFCLVDNPEYKARMAVQPSEQKVHLTVFLPSGSYNVLLVDANTKMKKVLQMICAKRQLTASNFMLMVEHMSWESDSQSESEVGEVEWQSIPGSVRVGDLESTAVTLVQKTGAATLQGEEAWYTGFAAQSKTYSHIIYLKKKNLSSSSKEKSASLDIDQDAITVTVIRKKRQPKTFKIAFENIVAVHQSEAKPTQFNVDCSDHRTFMFEAPNPVMAKEILFRIQFLIDMENEARALALANPVP